MIRVTPDGSKRREFARWAVRHRVNTVTSVTFGVPDDLFPEIPDELLVGARVDGQPYVVPLSDAGEPDDESDGAIVDSDAADTSNDSDDDDASTVEPEPEPKPEALSEPPSTPDIEPSPFPFTVPALTPAPEPNPTTTTTAPVSGVVPF